MNPSLLAVLRSYGLSSKEILSIDPLGNGLIHGTYLVRTLNQNWVLQAYNSEVFPFPDRIASNLGILSDNGIAQALDYQLPLPIENLESQRLTRLEGSLWRVFPFVKGRTLESIDEPRQAYLAALAFGQLTNASISLPVEDFQETIPNFHRLDLRFETFLQASKEANSIGETEKELIDFYSGQESLVKWYTDQLGKLPLRVTHNDTKINNLIFSEDLNSVEAVIDLDTLMGGYLLYDFGDLLRTVACSVPETSTDWNAITMIPEIAGELVKGYWDGIQSFASPEEAKSLLFGGEVMTLIMGLRFLTDHLQGNKYYRVAYPEQNFHRAKNQMIFLQSQQSQRDALKQIFEKVTGLSF